MHERAPDVVQLFSALREGLGRDGILSMDLTLATYWAAGHMPVYEPRTLLNPYNFMALGFGLPAAIGAKIAQPEKRVVAMCGDGGLLFTAQELATMVQYEVPVCVVLLNNDCYGAIERHQDRRYDGRVVDARLTNPDFVRLAEAFGVRAQRLESTQGLGAAIRAAVDGAAPALIEVRSDGLTAPF